MAGETYLSISGRLTGEPELRFTTSGAAVASFTVAVNARKFNKQSNEWENKPAKFWRCVAWNQGKLSLAENICEALKKGDAVTLYGEIETRKYTSKEGEERTVDEIRVEHIGKDLLIHVPAQASGGGFASSVPASSAPANDPWSNGNSGNSGGPWSPAPDTMPPF